MKFAKRTKIQYLHLPINILSGFVVLSELPEATESSPNFIQVGNQRYKKVKYIANWNEKDLTNTTWLLNGYLPYLFKHGYSINFISNNQTFSSMTGGGSLSDGGARFFYYSGTYVMDWVYGWSNSNYATVTFTSNNSSLADVIENYATLISTENYGYELV